MVQRMIADAGVAILAHIPGNLLMEIYSRAVIGDIAVDLRYRFNGPGVIAYLRNLCPSMGFVCAA